MNCAHKIRMMLKPYDVQVLKINIDGNEATAEATTGKGLTVKVVATGMEETTVAYALASAIKLQQTKPQSITE